MSRELQPTDFEQSPYERPAKNWECGWAASGQPCPRGPSVDGRCTITHECTPVRLGNRWVCSRPLSHGGSCEDGPLPHGGCCRPVERCQPARTLRHRRGRMTRWATAVAAAWLAFSVSGPEGHDVVSPGPVTSAHGPVESKCGSCHAAGAGGPGEWFGAAFARSSGPSDSARCQECHDLGPSARKPHSVGPADLAILTESAKAAKSAGGLLMLAGFGPGPPTNADGDLACATCHREHTGRAADLSGLSNSQCQVCHQSKFTDFGDGHPAFTDYPYVRRTRIQFDHATHRRDHFPQEGTEFACRGCHQPDPQGQVMLVEGFEQDCESCHAKDVGVTDGVAFIQLPGIDTDALSAAGVQIGYWPAYADIDQDSRFSPYLRIMLASDPRNAEAFDALPSGPDELILAELGGDEDEARAVGQLVWAIKELLYELSTENQAALKEHLDSGLQRAMPEPELAKLSGNFDFDLVSYAVRIWFPNLASEILEQRSRRASSGETGYDLESHRTRAVDTSGMSQVEPVWGWSIDPDAVAIRYRPQGHADPLMQSWLDAVVQPDRAPAIEFAFATLTTSEADGKCAKCHSVDDSERATLVNWQQKRRDKRERGFTRYMHRPHLIQPELKDCSRCHMLESGEASANDVGATEGDPVAPDEAAAPSEAADASTAPSDEADASPAAEHTAPAWDSKASYARSFADGNHDPAIFGSNFAPIDRSTCASCHRSGAASDSCLNCHDYHVHPSRLKGVQASAPAVEPVDEAVE